MMIENNASIKEIVEYGLETLAEDEMIAVNLKDLIYIHQVLTEFMRFFHQPMHYPKLENITDFLGDKNSAGGFEVLSIALYKKMYKMLPLEIQQRLDEGVFQNPLHPEYYESSKL